MDPVGQFWIKNDRLQRKSFIFLTDDGRNEDRLRTCCRTVFFTPLTSLLQGKHKNELQWDGRGFWRRKNTLLLKQTETCFYVPITGLSIILTYAGKKKHRSLHMWDEGFRSPRLYRTSPLLCCCLILLLTLNVCYVLHSHTSEYRYITVCIWSLNTLQNIERPTLAGCIHE